MSLLHKEFHTSDYNFYCPDLSKNINYVFVDKTKTSGKMKLVFLNTNEVSSLEYRKKLCDCLGKGLNDNEIKNIKHPGEKDFVITGSSAKIRSKFIKYFDDDFDFPKLGKFKLSKIISEPTELDKTVANKIDSNNPELVYGVKLLPEKWKESFKDNKTKALQSQDVEFMKIYDEKISSKITPSKEESDKQKRSQEKLQKHDLEHRTKGLKKLHKQILTIASSIDKLVTEYNNTIDIINNYMSGNVTQFNEAKFEKTMTKDNLKEFLEYCIPKEGKTEQQNQQPAAPPPPGSGTNSN